MNLDAVLSNLSLGAILPQMIVLGVALAVLLLDVARLGRRALGLLSLAGVLAAGVAAVWIMPGPLEAAPAFQDAAAADRFALVTILVIAVAAALAILLSFDYVRRLGVSGGTYYGLLLLSASGMMFMGAGTHLITIFLSLEIMSLSLYALAGLNRSEVRSGEAALKYFLLGGFSSAFLLYGMALVYGATGSTSLAGIAAAIPAAGPWNGLLLVGVGLILIGLGFKVAAVPFHMWTPDVYQGAPTSVTAFMSVGAKAAGFAALVRLLVSAFPALQSAWVWPVAGMAALTMTWGNLAALSQGNVKRMLAYSSIAHAGYILVGVAAGADGAGGVLFYLMAYALMNIGAFAVLIALERTDIEPAGITLERLQGLFHRQPWMAAAMTIFMLSLAGIPPLVGFFGKVYVFGAAIQSGLIWLAVFGVINSFISAYYYLRVVARMAMAEPEAELTCARCAGLNAGTILAAVGTVVVGLWPTPVLNLVRGAVSALFGG